ncbi:hypothetical protein JTB14_012066 [Gonioctena quinquepunctata]|nr:hypothetical protein JTB14_012066 [Gonioctena quinquepunctata]
MSDDSDNIQFSDEEIDDRKHEKLVEDVLNLNKKQNVKKPSRTEPTTQISEFNLVKSLGGNGNIVHINELTKLLKGRKKHVEISKKVKSTSSKSKTLPTPLEKPQADLIKRTLNYEKSRLQLDRWEALVTSNRAATTLAFPLGSTEKVKFEEKKAELYPSTWRIKSDLQKELEKLKPNVEEFHIETQEKDQYPLTLEELKDRRKEAAKLRAHQSFKEAKARRQNKIKSKKYHRILRREKIKQQLKDFEELQKTNPEEALKKLEDIEKARAEERFSLRHKGTGQWARNKQIRAKYDKESRQVLAQQLGISRELTQKIKTSVGSDSEDEGIESEENSVNTQVDDTNPWVNGIEPDKEVKDFISGYKILKNKTNTILKKTVKGPKNKQLKLRKLESNIEINLKNKSKLLKGKSKTSKKKRKSEKVESTKKQKLDLSFPSRAKRPLIDESMAEQPKNIDDENNLEMNSNLNALKTVLESAHNKQVSDINPNEYIQPKKTNLSTAIPDILATGENEEPDQKDIILEAFEDDDIAADFEKEKIEEIDKDTPKDIDLNLPGWGSWAGGKIDPNKRKRKRLIFKAPPKMPRKDDNKGSLIINEKAQSKIKPLLVSELPFPFKTVKDFEASIRAPIGSTFVTETAFRKHIEPAVTTKLGAIIEPLDRSILSGVRKF